MNNKIGRRRIGYVDMINRIEGVYYKLKRLGQGYNSKNILCKIIINMYHYHLPGDNVSIFNFIEIKYMKKLELNLT